jgi:hypothetical protein
VKQDGPVFRCEGDLTSDVLVQKQTLPIAIKPNSMGTPPTRGNRRLAMFDSREISRGQAANRR